MIRNMLAAGLSVAALLLAGSAGATLQDRPLFFRNVTLLTAGPQGKIPGGRVLVESGKIIAVGDDLDAPAGAEIIDGAGAYLTPGLIDCHSHNATAGGVNEGSLSVTSMVRIGDVIDPDDIDIYRDLAGGVTTANILHGSANAIGGQNQVIKHRWGATAEGLKFEGAPPGIKFALGENPKRGGSSTTSPRYPGTRMGVEDVIRDAFNRAREYQRQWKEYSSALAAKRRALPPRRDLELEPLVEVLEGRRLVHCHCYRADEILMILRLAEEYGFRVATLQHVLEGYKVAPEIAAHGAGASTFSDWWAYKIEAFDAIPYNAALMTRAGVTVSINSDSAEEARHLNQEAAKCIRYGGLSEEEALKLVTLNPAKQLRIDQRVGSIERGKDADLVLWDKHPFDTGALPQTVWIDGRIYFSRELDAERRRELEAERKRLAPERTPRTPPTADRPFENPPALELESTLKLPPDAEVVVVRGGTVHTAAGGDIANGVIVIRGGRIVEVGPGLATPAGARVVDAAGLHVWPGLIDANSQIGLTEIGSIAVTSDTSELGDLKPQLEAYDAINPDSEHIPTTRVAGVTTVAALPSGGTFSGRAVLMDLAGWTIEEMAVARFSGLSATIPASPTGSSASEQRTRAEAARRAASVLLEQARHYKKAREAATGGGSPPPVRDERLEALLPVIDRKVPVLARASSIAAIRAAVAWAATEKLRLVIVGGSQAGRLAGFLAARKIPVIYGPVQSLPDEEDDPYDYPYSTPAILLKAGVPVAISAASTSFTRTLPFEAGTAAAGGLSHDEALRAVTLYPAEILGADHLIGSIRPGRLANLVITDGPILQITTQVKQVLIRGREVPAETRHTRLWEKYQRRK